MEEDEDVYVRYMKLGKIRNIRRDFHKIDKKGSELGACVIWEKFYQNILVSLIFLLFSSLIHKETGFIL